MRGNSGINPNRGLAGIKNQVKILGAVTKLIEKRGNEAIKGTYGVPMLTTAE